MTGYIFKVSLMHVQEPVWRRIVIPSGITFQDLNDILQISFGWDGCHAHRFRFPFNNLLIVPHEIHEADYGFEGDEMEEADALIDDAVEMVKSFQHRYDFGDCWDHKLVYEKDELDYNARYASVLKYKGDNYVEDLGTRELFDLKSTNNVLEKYSFLEETNENDHELREKLMVRETPDDQEKHWLRFAVKWNNGKDMPKGITHMELIRGEDTRTLIDLVRGRNGLFLLEINDIDFDETLSGKQMRKLYVDKVLADPDIVLKQFEKIKNGNDILTEIAGWREGENL